MEFRRVLFRSTTRHFVVVVVWMGAVDEGEGDGCCGMEWVRKGRRGLEEGLMICMAEGGEKG
jgi:hypothetical protein